MSRLHDFLFGLKIGATVNTIDEPVEETVIRYKDKFLAILENEKGEIKDLSWFRGGGMTHTPIKDYWTAKEPRK